jgi:uncharacterized protein (DUF2249 family)
MKLRESRAKFWEESHAYHLDIRPLLDAEEEPFSIIMEAVHQLHKEKTLIIHAYFEPLPLMKQLRLQNFSTLSTKIEGDHWELEIKRLDIAENN